MSVITKAGIVRAALSSLYMSTDLAVSVGSTNTCFVARGLNGSRSEHTIIDWDSCALEIFNRRFRIGIFQYDPRTEGVDTELVPVHASELDELVSRLSLPFAMRKGIVERLSWAPNKLVWCYITYQDDLNDPFKKVETTKVEDMEGNNWLTEW